MIQPPHGGQLRRLAADYNLRPEDLLDLSANINPEGPPASVFAALRAALEDPASLVAYPDLELHDLRQALAAHHHLPPDSFVLANGFVPVLEAILRTRRPKRCLLPVPCFSEYRQTLERSGVTVVPYPLSPHNFSYAGLAQAAELHLCDILLLANPQNPSGHLTPASDLRALLKLNITLLLDEAFIDYAPEQSLTADTAHHPNLIVFRSVTKFFAIPGLRVAYAVLQSAAPVNPMLPPWPVTTLATHAVRAALEDQDYALRTRILNLERRTHVERSLQALGIAFHPAAANFLLLEPPLPTWSDLLIQHHLILRNCDNFESLAPGYLRTAISTEANSTRLLKALDSARVTP